jgi:hypothetical protein
MNSREKTLGAVVGGIFLLFAGGMVVQQAFIAPMKDRAAKIVSKREALKKLMDEKDAYLKAREYLKDTAPRIFARDPDAATAAVGKLLTEQILALGLPETQFTRQPSVAKKLRGGVAYEIGWNVQGEGPMNKMIDLLFVLEKTPQIHRVENLALSAGDQPGRLKARFRFLTLVIDSPPEGGRADLTPKFALDSPERRFYDCIAQRDLLRPYAQKSPAQSSSSTDRPGMLKVVSLAQWGGFAEATVRDTDRDSYSTYKVGDTFEGAVVSMIDYRTLPVPNKPGLLSSSRVILKIGGDYWAVEQGQTLADKYQLTAAQLPAQLRGQ